MFRRFFGLKYLVNKSTGEIHRVSKITGACGVRNMARKNKLYVTKSKMLKLIANDFKFNGCVHCFKVKDTD